MAKRLVSLPRATTSPDISRPGMSEAPAGGRVVQPLALLHVGAVHAGGEHADQHFAGAWNGRRPQGRNQHFGPARPGDFNGGHSSGNVRFVHGGVLVEWSGVSSADGADGKVMAALMGLLPVAPAAPSPPERRARGGRPGG